MENISYIRIDNGETGYSKGVGLLTSTEKTACATVHTSDHNSLIEHRSDSRQSELLCCVTHSPDTKVFLKIYRSQLKKQLFPIAGRSKAQVFSRLIAGISGLNPDGGINICLFFCCCCVGNGLCD
jgi:hypothetical protein